MRCILVLSSLRCTLLATATLLGGCASPVFKETASVDATPADVAARPERYHGADVIWGGKILDVRNRAASSEIEVIAYPLDRAQRPQQTAAAEGRFIIVMPGFVEPLDFPPGRFVTLRGRVSGARSVRVDEHDTVFPLVENAVVHLWPVNFPYERPRIRFGIGLGIGVR